MAFSLVLALYPHFCLSMSLTQTLFLAGLALMTFLRGSLWGGLDKVKLRLIQLS